MQTNSIIPQSQPISRLEFWLVSLLLLTAAIVRIAAFDRMAVEHFDEGVYASNLWFGAETGFAYPQRQFYAPPLFPFLVEISISLWGTSAVGCMTTSLLCGLATVACVWWIARCWFGTAGGITALSLAACSDFHVQFSRMCLTDVPVCLALLISVFLFSRLPQRPIAWYGFAAGSVAALAWWIKYTGWLALAICAAAGLADIVCRRRWGRIPRRLALGWLVMVSSCLLLCTPMFQQLQPSGGYTAIARNHAGYLVGPSGWLAAVGSHQAIQRHYDDWSTLAGLLLAVVLSQWLQWPSGAWRQETGSQRLRMICALAGLGSLAGLLSTVIGTVPLLLTAAVWGLIRNLSRTHRDPHPGRALPGWLLLTWIAGLMCSVPMYQPFPRLALPWIVAVWLGAASLAVRPVQGQPVNPTTVIPSKASSLLSLAVIILFAISLVVNPDARGRFAAWQDQTQMAQAAKQIRATIHKNTSPEHSASPVVYTYAEPALFYQLSALSVSSQPIDSLAFAHHTPPSATQVFLVWGPQAAGSQPFAAEWGQVAHRFLALDEIPYAPTDLVRFNSEAPDAADRGGHTSRQPLKLFRLRHPGVPQSETR